MNGLPLDRTPRRPVLAPGLRALPVAGEVRIGLASPLRVRDSPALRRVLTVLARGETPPDTPATRRVLRELAPVLRDGDTLVHPAVPPGEVAAVALAHRDVAGRLALRAEQRVRVVGDLGLAPALDAEELVRRSGLRVCASDPTLVLVLSRGEPDRADLDPLLRTGTPHLLVRAVESSVVLGPFVVPGRTACLRCVDAHEADRDAARPVLLREYLRTPRLDGVADPVPSAVAVAALGLAVADLVRFADQEEPCCWSATLALTSGRAPGGVVRWLRHQACGCSWGARREDTSDTMDA
jgi:hypothetical protein